MLGRRTAALSVLLVASALGARGDETADAMRAALAGHGASLVRVEATTFVNVDRLPGVARQARRTHEVSTSGVVVGDDGLVLLPARALDPAEQAFALLGAHATADVLEVTVVGRDGRVREAEWLGRAPGTGLAFCRVAPTGRAGLEAVAWGDATPRLGERLLVLSVGPAATGRPATCELARVAFAGDDLFGLTPQLPHALGALVVSVAGRAVGVVGTLPRAAPTGDGDLLRPDLLAQARAGYLLPAARLAPAIADPPREAALATGRRARSWLGAKHEFLTPELAELHDLDVDVGIRIAKVYEGGPAAQAGLQVDDVLLDLDGEPLDLDPGESFADLIEDYPPGSVVTLELRRGGATQTVRVELERGPTRPRLADRRAVPAVGLLAREVTFYDREERGLPEDTPGVLVVEVAPDGAASRAGLRPGDLITAIGDQAVGGLRDVEERLSGEGTHPLTVDRRGEELTLRVRR